MATYYVDPAATGTGSGADWTNAFTTLAAAIAKPVAAGDTVYARGTETLSSGIIINVGGDTTSGFIKFIGCNASGNVDGTTYKIDGNSAVTDGLILQTNAKYTWWENIEVYNCNAHGVNPGTLASWNVWYNFISRNNGNSGWNTGGTYNFWFYCRGTNNAGGYGWNNPPANNFWIGCVAANNADTGYLVVGAGGVFIESIAADNGATSLDQGFRADARGLIFGCVADNEYTGVTVNDLLYFVMRTRMTNCTEGLTFNSSGDVGVYGFNLFHNNTSDVVDNGAGTQIMRNYATADSNKYDPDSDDGYNNASNEDFNLKRNRTYNGDGSDTIGLGIGT